MTPPEPDSAPLTILFAMHVERGHVCAGLRLAGFLESRGHRVVYLGMTGSKELILENGFDFVPVFEDTDGARQFDTFLKRCVDGSLDARIAGVKPDVILCDSLLWYVALRGMFLKIPVVNLSIPTSGSADANVPPSVLGRIPGASAWGRFQVRADWRLLRWRFFFTKRMASMLMGAYRSPTRMHHLIGVFRSMARHAAVPCIEGKTYRFTEFGPQLILPEITLTPGPLEFPGAQRRIRPHLGDLTELGRAEDTRLLDQLDPEKPLVYCSLGSVSHMYKHAGRFFRAAIAASRLRPEWQWVVAVSGQPEAGIPRVVEGNLLVTDWAPQLALLARAGAVVTHGGIGTIVECIHFGVPMVIVPGGRDQPGNMARAVYHGIALSAGMASITAPQLAAKVAEAMASPNLRAALARMKAKIVAENHLDAAADLIEAAAQ